jgi:hypothetical protein
MCMLQEIPEFRHYNTSVNNTLVCIVTLCGVEVSTEVGRNISTPSSKSKYIHREEEEEETSKSRRQTKQQQKHKRSHVCPTINVGGGEKPGQNG